MKKVPVLRVDGLSKTFRIRSSVVRAADTVSLEIAKGETLAVVGESGSGKTTLANMILGIERPDDGAIYLDGTPVPPHRDRAFKRRVGLVQQNPYSALNPRKPIRQIVGLPLAIHGIAERRARRSAVLRLLEQVGIPAALAERRPLALSGGQRQRVAIARALSTGPELLVLDEPTASLDVSVQAHILELLKDLQQRLELTYLFITHDLSVVRVLATHVAVMYRGRVVETGPVEAIFTAPRHRYTNLLLASIPTVSAEDDRCKPDWPWDHVTESAAQDDGTGCAFRARCPFAIGRCATERPELNAERHGFACFNPAPDPAGSAAQEPATGATPEAAQPGT